MRGLDLHRRGAPHRLQLCGNGRAPGRFRRDCRHRTGPNRCRYQTARFQTAASPGRDLLSFGARVRTSIKVRAITFAMSSYREIKAECYEANLLLPQYKLIDLTFGNVSVADPARG